MLGQAGREFVDKMRATHGSDVTIFRNKDTSQELRFDGRAIQNTEKEGIRRRFFSFPQNANIDVGDIVQINGARDLWHIIEVEDHVVGGVFVQVKAIYEKYNSAAPGRTSGERTMDPKRLLEFAAYSSSLSTLAADVNGNADKLDEYYKKSRVLCVQFDKEQPNGIFIRNKIPVEQLDVFEESWRAILKSMNMYPWGSKEAVVNAFCLVAQTLRSIASEMTQENTVGSVKVTLQSAEPKTIGSVKPRLFIGSSVEGIEIAEKIQEGLDHSMECTIWSQGVFGLSYGTLESLVAATKKFDCAVLVLTPDDVKIKRNDTKNSPRDNVLFELGLFIGALGRNRTFIVYCRDEQLDIPSDLAGVTAAKFGRRSDGNLRAALGPVCSSLKDAIKAAMAEE